MDLKVRLSLLILVGLGWSASLNIINAAEDSTIFDAAKKIELRELANELFGPLPDAMPGSENDTDYLKHLGEKLYFDTRLSKNNTISCNSCHRVDQGLGGVDNASGSTGAFGDIGDRNAPTVLNAGFQLAQFWDGRAEDLKAQAKGPILNPIEMAMPHEGAVLDRIRMDDTYRALFKKAFPESNPTITYDNVAEAIAAFERTLITEDRFDDFLEGDNEALTQKELEGLETFTAIGCTTCHAGPLLGGAMYQKVGLVYPYENFSDIGLEAVTKNEDDKYKFKVPTLRNIAITGPYFHDGGVATLGFAVRKMAYMQLGQQLSTEQTESILAFFGALTDKNRPGK